MVSHGNPPPLGMEAAPRGGALSEQHPTVREAAQSQLGEARAHDRAAALTATAYVIQGNLRFGDWVQQGRRLGVIGRSAGWWIGDWLSYGNARYGDRYARASRITGYDTQTLMNMVYVASRFEPSRRRESLSWSHHAELAALPQKEQERWLTRAESDRLSVRCLREEIRRERRVIEGRRPKELAAGDGYRERTLPDHVHCPACGNEFAVAEGDDGAPAARRGRRGGAQRKRRGPLPAPVIVVSDG